MEQIRNLAPVNALKQITHRVTVHYRPAWDSFQRRRDRGLVNIRPDSDYAIGHGAKDCPRGFTLVAAKRETR